MKNLSMLGAALMITHFGFGAGESGSSSLASRAL